MFSDALSSLSCCLWLESKENRRRVQLKKWPRMVRDRGHIPERGASCPCLQTTPGKQATKRSQSTTVAIVYIKSLLPCSLSTLCASVPREGTERERKAEDGFTPGQELLSHFQMAPAPCDALSVSRRKRICHSIHSGRVSFHFSGSVWLYLAVFLLLPVR